MDIGPKWSWPFYRDTTRHWQDGKIPRGYESHPVVYVSWHDARKYCEWLSGVTGKSILLPSEAQWEKAARGWQDKRAYPWGDKWDETRCNNSEFGIGETTPAGIFPEGMSPVGCLDMSGDVWEWTTTIWGLWDQAKSEATLQYPYPYAASDGRENLAGDDNTLRVLRGGSFIVDQDDARCAFRNWDWPHTRHWDSGFRVVVAPISPTSAL
jgi:toxoflavin biosynthesis protein ToxD